MNQLIDEVARLLASPVPRRRTFKLLGGMLAAGLFAGFGRAQDQLCGGKQCKKDEVCCGGVECCKKKEICCPSGPPWCVTGKKKTCASSPT